MKFIVTLLFIFSMALPVITTATPTFFTYESTTNNADGKDSFAAIGLNFIGQSELNLSRGINRYPDQETSSYSIGIMFNPDSQVAFGLNYLYWEQTNEVESSAYELEIDHNTDNWFFAISSQLGAVTIYPQTAPSINLNKSGAGISTAYSGSYPFTISSSIEFYFYDRKLSFLNTSQYPRFTMHNFSMSTLDQATGLEDHQSSLNLTYHFEKLNLGYFYDRSHSAVDNSISTSHSVLFEIKITDKLQLGFETGESTSSINSSTVRFNRFATNYYF